VQTNESAILAALIERKYRVSRTLWHLDNEKRCLQESSGFMCSVAYHNRLKLLERLTAAYHEEIGHIDRALNDPAAVMYRACHQCYEPIEEDQLQSHPGAMACRECKEYKSARGIAFAAPLCNV
jgi:RNA polymerase-binding transcription factor DksA